MTAKSRIIFDSGNDRFCNEVKKRVERELKENYWHTYRNECVIVCVIIANRVVVLARVDCCVDDDEDGVAAAAARCLEINIRTRKITTTTTTTTTTVVATTVARTDR